MKHSKTILAATLSLGTALLVLTSCETDKDNKIAQAQSCLDSARTAADAHECEQKIVGIDDPKASLVRCGATYLMQGYNTAAFTEAYNKLKTPATGENPMLSLMTYVGFKFANTYHGFNSSPNTEDAAYASTECTNSESPGLAWLSSMTRMATLIYAQVGGFDANNPPTVAQMATALAATNDTAVLTVFGNEAIKGYQQQCVGTSQEGTAACNDLKTAYDAAGGDPVAVANQLKTLLQN